MLLGALCAVAVTRSNLVGQTPTPVPADPPAPPLIPAADPAPIPSPSPASTPATKSAEKKTPARKNAPKAAAKSAPKAAAAATKPADHPSAADLKAGPAVATEKNVNVRGQAAINSEIVTHLKRGDVVTVLEQTTLAKHGTDEPAKWAKISLPAGSFVWVHSGFTENGKVKVNRLNLRSGPGENFSILGRIDKGTEVREIEKKGEWIKIESPAAAYAYAAAHLLSQDAALLAAAQTKAAPVATAATTAKPVVTDKPVETVAVTPSPAVVIAPPTVTPPPAESTPAPARPEPSPTTPLTAAATPPTPPPAAPEPPPSAPASEPVPIPAGNIEPLVKRIVTREGIVRGSASIQAPTYFVLRGLDNNKTINYLHSVDTNLVIRSFQHQRVIVVGEEVLDERWPNTPVIDVESIQAVP